MAKEFFKDLPNTTTPITAGRLNGLLDGEEAMGKIVVDDISSKNLFNKDSATINDWYIQTSNNKILASAEHKTTYLKVNPNTTYTISKKAGAQFRIGTATNVPAIEGVITQTIANHTGSSITITTGANDNYLVITFWSTSDTITLTEMLATLQVELGDKATSYTPYKEFDNSKIVHKHIYSLQEHIVGTWHNGKPVYEKTLVFSAGIGTSDINGRAFPLTDFGITNVEEAFLRQPTHFTGIHSNRDVNVPFPYYNGVHNYYAEACPLHIRIICTDQVAVNKRMVLTLNYTKTTD